MTLLSSFFDYIVRGYAILATVPFIPFLVVWGVVYLIKQEKKVATKWAMDITTVLLFGGVAALYNTIFQSSFGFYLLLLIFLLAFGLVGNLQHKTKGKLDLPRVTRAIWRLGFLFLAASYIILGTIGLASNIG